MTGNLLLVELADQRLDWQCLFIFHLSQLANHRVHIAESIEVLRGETLTCVVSVYVGSKVPADRKEMVVDLVQPSLVGVERLQVLLLHRGSQLHLQSLIPVIDILLGSRLSG